MRKFCIFVNRNDNVVETYDHGGRNDTADDCCNDDNNGQGHHHHGLKQ
jgi:hypothetical protein